MIANGFLVFTSYTCINYYLFYMIVYRAKGRNLPPPPPTFMLYVHVCTAAAHIQVSVKLLGKCYNIEKHALDLIHL